MAQDTLVNGNRYSFVNLSVTRGMAQLSKGVFKSINYDGMQDAGIVQGNRIQIVGRTAGYGTATGSFEMLLSEINDFFDDITNSGQIPIGTAEFDLAVSYSINDVDIVTDELIGCRITKVGTANQQGNDASTKSCDLSIALLRLNGNYVFADPLEA
jgi:hypothetical protein